MHLTHRPCGLTLEHDSQISPRRKGDGGEDTRPLRPEGPGCCEGRFRRGQKAKGKDISVSLSRSSSAASCPPTTPPWAGLPLLIALLSFPFSTGANLAGQVGRDENSHTRGPQEGAAGPRSVPALISRRFYGSANWLRGPRPCNLLLHSFCQTGVSCSTQAAIDAEDYDVAKQLKMDIEKLRFVSAAEAASGHFGGGGSDYASGPPHHRSGGARLGGLPEDAYDRPAEEADPYGESPPLDDQAGSFGGRDGGTFQWPFRVCLPRTACPLNVARAHGAHFATAAAGQINYDERPAVGKAALDGSAGLCVLFSLGPKQLSAFAAALSTVDPCLTHPVAQV